MADRYARLCRLNSDLTARSRSQVLQTTSCAFLTVPNSPLMRAQRHVYCVYTNHRFGMTGGENQISVATDRSPPLRSSAYRLSQFLLLRFCHTFSRYQSSCSMCCSQCGSTERFRRRGTPTNTTIMSKRLIPEPDNDAVYRQRKLTTQCARHRWKGAFITDSQSLSSFPSP